MRRSEVIPRLLFQPSWKEERFAEEFFSGTCSLLKSVFNPEGLPREDPASLPEIAFLGRSNVGKSSLINGLLGRKGLAIASSKPGRTRSLNFYTINQKLMFVDMPGYGYGTRSYFSSLVNSYLTNRKRLRSCCLLVDSVVGAKESDQLMAEALDKYQIPYQVVLTKVDKLREGHVQRVVLNVMKMTEDSPLAFPQVFPVSVKASTGVNLLRCYLLSHVGLLRPTVHSHRWHQPVS